MQPSLFHSIFTVFCHEFRLTLSQPVSLLTPVFFSFLVVSLFPLAMGNDPVLLTKSAPAILIMITLLATLMAVDGMYREDYEDGSLLLMQMSPVSSYFLHATKVFVHWFASGLLIGLCSPLLALLLNLPINSCLDILFAVILASLTLVYLGAIGAALTVALKNTGLLLVLIILPLYVPVLILSSAAIQASVQQLSTVANYLGMLAALACLAVSLAPLAIAFAIKINLSTSG